MADLPLTLGRNLMSLTYQSDMTERASRIAPISKALGGQATPLGYARWRVTDPDSGPKTFVNEDPAGGAGLVGFTNQCVGWYVLLERTGESFRITATDPDTQEITLATWSASIVEGEIFQLRLSAPGTVFTSYSYRQSVAGVLPPPPGIPIMDAEVTALAGSVITVRDGWLNGGPQPVASDGQHVGRTVRLSTLVATDEITDFLAVDGEYWYTVADVSDYQVGDWVRRAADNGSTYYGDINSLITPAFPAAMTIVEIDSGANAFRVVSRDGGTTLNRTIFDTAVYGSGYCDLRVYRPVATLATVTASSGSAHTLTLDDVSTFSVSGGPGAVEILIANTSTSGKVPWYLEHPVYVQEAPTGIGVKLKTIDRSDWLGVQNLVPNGVMRVWTTPTSLPDGWLGATSLGAIGSATPSNFVIGQNTDPLYTRVGGKSLFFSTTNGVLYVPAIAWTPQYVGQRFSTRPSLILTKWDGNAALITLQLGIMQADGTVLPWYEQPRSVLLQPATATNPRPDPPFRKEPAGTWVDMALQDFDITEPSAYAFNPQPSAGDIANLSAAQGIVACLSFNGGGSTIEGYLDGIAIVTAHEAPADVAEFYDANRLHQDANVQLAEFGPPQFTVGVDFYDAKRMNPTLDEPDAAKGVVVLINEASFGISNVRRRITDVVRNMNVPGETRLTIAKRRRRISDAVAKPPATKPPPVTSGSSSGGGTPSGTGGPSVSVSIAIDDSLVPTATAVGDPSVVRVKFAWRTDRAPTLAEVQAAASVLVVTGTPTTSTAPFALATGETAYVAAVGYTSSNVESAKADASLTVPPSNVVAPLVFLRRGVGLKTGDWGAGSNAEVEALGDASNGDPVSAHLDVSGNALHHLAAINPNFLTYDNRFVPMRDGDEVRLGVGTFNGSTPIGRRFSFSEFSALTEGEIWINARPVDGTPASDGTNVLWFLGNANTLFPKASDGHIYEGAGRSSAADCGAVPGGGASLEAIGTWYRVSIGPAGETNNFKVYLNGTLLHQETLGVVGFGGYGLGSGSSGYFDGRYGDYLIFARVLTSLEAAAWAPYVGRVTDTPPTEFTGPRLRYVRSGGDVIVTLHAPGADSGKIAGDLAGVPSDADVRAEDAITSLPIQRTYPAPGAGETLHVKAFGYAGVTESAAATLDIVGSAGSGTPGDETEGGGNDEGTAPTNAEYLLAAMDGALPNARVATDTDSVAWDFATPGQAKAHVTGGQAPPTRIADGETFTVPVDRQVLYALPIIVDGDLVVDGDLIEVT